MRFERLRIRGFKSHDDTELSLRPGVTVIHGVNGSGKSSLLEACFFALYGSAAIDGTLDDAIANDAEGMEVVLSFTHDGADYRVEREVKISGETAQTTTCVLETPDEPIDGVTDVEAHIQGLLRMDADAFVNCAYVRQGEVNKLINASPGERQDMIDELLQLGKLETYRERASDARVGVKRVRDRKRELLADRNRTIETKQDKDLHGRLNARESELSELKSQIEAKETERANAEQTLENAEQTLEEYEERRTELDELRTEIEELTGTIAETERERDGIESAIRSHRETIDELETDLEALLADVPDPDDDSVEPLGDDPELEAVSARIAALDERADDVREAIETHRLNAQQHTNDAENATERAVELKQQATEAREEAAELDSEIDSVRAELDERRARIDEMDDEIEGLRETLAAGPVPREELEGHRESIRDGLAEKRERLAELRTERKNATESVREAERLREEGKCPECGQPVDGSPHLDHIERDRERVDELDAEIDSLEVEIDSLEEDDERVGGFIETADELDSLVDNRETVQSLLEQREEAVAEKAERVESLRSEAEEYEETAEEYEETAEEYEQQAAAARSEIGELNGNKSRIDERRQRLERIESLLSEVAETEREIETLRERRKNAAEVNDQRRERLSEKRDRKADLEASFDESAIEKATSDKQRAETYLSKVEPFLEEKRTERDELQNKIGAVKNELDELETLKTQRDELEATVKRLESLYDEAARLQETYESLRAELRQRNVDRLETMLNELFDLVYQNDSYSRIELDGEYELTVYQKDGTPLDPDQLSGGERALFNLSLRCAIYRLLSEGIEGQAPTPPLILDEPTVFLDSGHVSKLVELIDSMTQHGVAQIIVVSHDEELVGAADDLIAVQKDPTTNRSTVERTATADALQ
jgi:exonuclease SbcC